MKLSAPEHGADKAIDLIERTVFNLLAEKANLLDFRLDIDPRDRRFAARTDAFALVTQRLKRGTKITITGGSERALWDGVCEFVKRCADGNVPEMDLTRTPFLRGREVMVGPCARSHPGLETRAKLDFEYWPIDQIEVLVNMLDFFGFDRIETVDEPCYSTGSKPEWPSREEIEAKTHAILRRARANEQKTTMFLWGNVIEKEPGHLEEYKGCLNDPTDAKRFKRDRRRRAQYAPEVDRIITHWADPGGCQRTPTCCDIRTPQRETVNLWRLFQNGNPEVDCFMSLWYLADKVYGKWRGYEGPSSILDSGILPPEVGLSTGGRYRPEDSGFIRDSGRRTGVWAWYLGDHEILPGLHVHIERMRNYFRSLPKNAGETLTFHTLDMCFQSPINYANAYVGSRLMWDPKYDTQQALEEFVSLALGPENRTAGAQAIRTLEQVRCHRTQELADEAHGTEHMTRCGEGSRDPERDYDLCNLALKRFALVKVNIIQYPVFPAPFRGFELADLLTLELEQLRDVAAFRASLKDLLKRHPKPTKKQLKGLPIPPVEWYFRPSFFEYLEIRRSLENLGLECEPLPKPGGLGYVPENVLCEW